MSDQKTEDFLLKSIPLSVVENPYQEKKMQKSPFDSYSAPPPGWTTSMRYAAKIGSATTSTAVAQKTKKEKKPKTKTHNPTSFTSAVSSYNDYEDSL